MEADRSLLTYEQLESHLKNEHKDVATLADVHRELAMRTKTNKESYMEYMYDMIKIGKMKLDDPSLVKYIVGGIQDDTSLKMTLFQATTIQE